jgi:hypothetical protein
VSLGSFLLLKGGERKREVGTREFRRASGAAGKHVDLATCNMQYGAYLSEMRVMYSHDYSATDSISPS